MDKLLEDPVKFKSFDIYQCLCPCEECTGSYSSEVLCMKVYCKCSCHNRVMSYEGAIDSDFRSRTSTYGYILPICIKQVARIYL